MKNFKLLPVTAIVLAMASGVSQAKTYGAGNTSYTDNGKISDGEELIKSEYDIHGNGNTWQTHFKFEGFTHKRFNILEKRTDVLRTDTDALKESASQIEVNKNKIADMDQQMGAYTEKIVTENLEKDVERNQNDILKNETIITGVNTDLREIRTDLRGLHRIEAGMDSFQDSIEDMQSDIDKIPALAKPDNVVTEGSGSELTLKRCPNTLEVTWDVCTYQVGDNGPAGGIVIYATEDGKHGQELSYKQPSSTFGCEGVAIPTEISDYPGAISTQTIANTNCEGGSLAEKALRYVTHVRYGWYIPSIGQLQSIHDHLEDIGLHIDEIYWSSTLVAENDEVSWGFDFMSNTPVQIKRSDSASVRFVRNF